MQLENGSSPAGSKPKLVQYADLDQLVFPSHITAYFKYYATGEGLTRGICMLYSNSPEELRGFLTEQWGEYFALVAEATSGLTLIPGFDDLIPICVHRALEEVDALGGLPYTFSFSATTHKNYA